MPIILALSARIGCGVSWVILIIFVSDSTNALLSFCGDVPQAAQNRAVIIVAVSCFICFLIWSSARVFLRLFQRIRNHDRVVALLRTLQQAFDLRAQVFPVFFGDLRRTGAEKRIAVDGYRLSDNLPCIRIFAPPF